MFSICVHSLTTPQPRDRRRCSGCCRFRLMLLALRRSQLHIIFSFCLPTEHYLRLDAVATCSATLFFRRKRTRRTEDLSILCPGHPEKLLLFWLRRRSGHSCFVVRSGSERFHVDFTGPGILQSVPAGQAAPRLGFQLELCPTGRSDSGDTDI